MEITNKVLREWSKAPCLSDCELQAIAIKADEYMRMVGMPSNSFKGVFESEAKRYIDTKEKIAKLSIK